MTDGYELFRPSEQEMEERYSSKIRRIITAEDTLLIEQPKSSSSLLAALNGSYYDFALSTDKPISEIILEGDKRGYILTDGKGVVAHHADEILVPLSIKTIENLILIFEKKVLWLSIADDVTNHYQTSFCIQ